MSNQHHENASVLIGASELHLNSKKAQQTVCRIKTQSSWGTGFLVAWPQRNGELCILTNHHVLNSPQVANTAQVEFRWQDSDTNEYLRKKDHPFEVRLDPESLFCTSQELDFTLVAIDRSTSFGICEPVKLASLEPAEADQVHLFGHPNGSPKQMYSTGV